jgi:hypothetical protein
MGGKLLDQERQEQIRQEELKLESERRNKQPGFADNQSQFESFGDPLR